MIQHEREGAYEGYESATGGKNEVDGQETRSNEMQYMRCHRDQEGVAPLHQLG